MRIALKISLLTLTIGSLSACRQAGVPCGNGTLQCDADAICQGLPPHDGCVCAEGYEGDGLTCKDVDECGRAPCRIGDTCVNLEGTYRCDPPEGSTSFVCEASVADAREAAFKAGLEQGREEGASLSSGLTARQRACRKSCGDREICNYCCQHPELDICH